MRIRAVIKDVNRELTCKVSAKDVVIVTILIAAVSASLYTRNRFNELNTFDIFYIKYNYEVIL